MPNPDNFFDGLPVSTARNGRMLNLIDQDVLDQANIDRIDEYMEKLKMRRKKINVQMTERNAFE